jgi:hypothetical protein
MPPRFQPDVVQHTVFSYPELEIMPEKAKGNDRSVEALVRMVEDVKDGWMLDMLQNFIRVCRLVRMLQSTYLAHEPPTNPVVHQIARFPDPHPSTVVLKPLCNVQ